MHFRFVVMSNWPVEMKNSEFRESTRRRQFGSSEASGEGLEE
jgi:hypothetical protein